MRNSARNSRSERNKPAFEEGDERDLALAAPLDEADDADDADEPLDEDLADAVRLSCPECRQPITVLAGEDRFPEHALCPTPWNPFGLTVCGGSGLPVTDALPVADGSRPGPEQDLAALLTLPAGLDWRTQPFSHVGGAGSRPMRVRAARLAA
ncbi:hypothetical protein [Streptomyces sp. HPF1205]|uniref:hypothetical protein n=1 Tax=Streptomyces sp. HPF1205 TaxID=2873262 RepID=UPI001CEDA321|nr:hypothetical protein [Streptomyces sp. HPF1205]